MNSRIVGIFQIILSGVCFGFLGIMGKSSYEAGLSPGELLAIRFSMASIVLFFGIKVFSKQSLKLNLRTWRWTALLGIFGYALFSSCYFYALKGLSASLTVLLLYSYPIYVLLGSWIFFKEKIQLYKAMAVPIALIGLGMTTWGQFQISEPTALFFGFMSAVLYALYVLFSGRYLKDANPLVSSAWIQFFAGAFLILWHIRPSFDLLNKVENASVSLILLILVGTIAAMSLFLAGLKKVSSWEASLLSTTEPIVGVLVGVFWLNESLGWLGYLGAVIVLISLVWVSLPNLPAKNLPTKTKL